MGFAKLKNRGKSQLLAVANFCHLNSLQAQVYVSYVHILRCFILLLTVFLGQ